MDREKQLLDIIRNMVGKKDIELKSDRSEIEEWDSLVHVMIIAALKEKMGINISIDDSEKIERVEDFLKND